MAGCLAAEKGDTAALGKKKKNNNNIYLVVWAKGACVFHMDQM